MIDLSRVLRLVAVRLVILCAALLVACDTASRPTVAADGSDPALDALADSLLPRLERLSGLHARSRPVLARRSVEQVRSFVERRLDEELPPEELRGVHGTYALLGVMPDTLDLRSLLLDLYTEQIVGYYDPEEKKLFIVEGVPAHAVRPVVAHELVHALQDQHANLDSLISRERGNDRQTAAQAVIEGHATLVMFALLAEEMTGRPVDPAQLPNPADQLRPALESPSEFPVFRTAPRILRETLLFPYVAGAGFLQEVWRARPDAPRTVPLDTLLPQSTEQVLNPHTRFILERDEPTELRFTTASPWTLLYEGTLGQLEMRLFLEEHLGTRLEDGGAGWDGDRYRLLEAPDGTRVLDWHSVWDDASSADRFTEQVQRIHDGRPDHAAATARIEIEGRPGLRVIIAHPSMLHAVPGTWVGIVDTVP